MSLWERIAAAFQDHGATSEIEVARIVSERQALAGELLKAYGQAGDTEVPLPEKSHGRTLQRERERDHI